jgi:hypothetical protein
MLTFRGCRGRGAWLPVSDKALTKQSTRGTRVLVELATTALWTAAVGHAEKKKKL